MLTNEETKALVLNRIRRSRETWDETKGIIEGCYWYAAANRMYYACYYMVSALLLKNGLNAHTHGGAIGLFDYISSRQALLIQIWGSFTANCSS